MKCWIKIAGTVLLIGFLGADVGLQSVLALNGTSPLAVAEPILSSLESAKITDAVQAISAVVVALFTVGLFWVGWQQAKILSEQHELSRRQAAIVERLQSPLISVEIETPGIEFNTAGLPRYRPSILKYRLKNHSDVPVFLLAVEETFQPIKLKGGLPKPISPTDPAIRPMSYGVLVPPHGRSEPMTKNLYSLILGQEQDSFYSTNVALFLTIFARFEDVFETRWVMALCYAYDDIAGNWLLAAGTKDHNYHRREIKTA